LVEYQYSCHYKTEGRTQVIFNREEDIINSKVFIENLSDDTTQMELLDLFSEVGQVLEIVLPTDESSGRLKGFAFIEFAYEASVPIALEKLNGHELNGKSLRISQVEDRPQHSQNARNQFSKSGRSSFKKPKSKGSRRNVRAKKRGG